MTERPCTHVPETMVVLIIQWCVRCSSWRYRRLLVEAGSRSDDSSSVHCAESHSLPAAHTDLPEVAALMNRALMAAQEMEEDVRDYRMTDPNQHHWGSYVDW